MEEKIIRYYETAEGKCPYEKWLLSLDKSIKDKISRRLDRVVEGNYGDFKWIDDDISELRFTIGKGYRIYFSEVDNIVILFLCGGDKTDQSKDIKKAKEYYNDYMERYENGQT
jgi:putative addiction module killer protein